MLSSHASLDLIRVRFRELVLPKVISSRVVTSYIRKAVRTRVWFSLNPYQRALLRAVSLSGVRVIKSEVLRELISELIELIERSSLRGRALWYGLVIALSRFGGLVSDWLSNIGSILYLGISYLSNPPLYRHYD